MAAHRSPRRAPIRYLAVVDGEHYPPVVQAALDDLTGAGHEVVGAVFVGGTEKLPAGVVPELDVEVRTGEPVGTLAVAIKELTPDAILDLSDEPVLDYRRRHELACVALYLGVPYEGADFSFTPPPRPRLCTKPSIAVISTGKRTGKTAVAGYVARTLKAAARSPVIVAMGRGGPAEPEVLRGDELELGPRDLLALAADGRHAASDYIEDALLARVPTVGCRRCGGGLAGGVVASNVAAGIAVAGELPGDLLVLEGSGSAVPPADADATVLVVPVSIPTEYLSGYMGPYRLLLADLVVVTMCEEPFGSLSRLSSITSRLKRPLRSVVEGLPDGEIDVIRTVFRPTPTRSVAGHAAVVATTAPEAAAGTIVEHLEGVHGCTVVGVTHSLSDRERLRDELMGLKGGASVLLCEIKAAGVDVATRWALDSGLDVVYLDNVPVGIQGDDLGAAVRRVAELATARFATRS